MWTISLLDDPVSLSELRGSNGFPPSFSALIHGSLPFDKLFVQGEQLESFLDGERTARVAMADFIVRRVAKLSDSICHAQDGYKVTLELLQRQTRHGSGRRHTQQRPAQLAFPPFMLERTDFWSCEKQLNVTVRAIAVFEGESSSNEMKLEREAYLQLVETAAKSILSKLVDGTDETFIVASFKHIACAVFQHRLRLELVQLKAIAFIADGSILPRRSGASSLPMASPPAIPFDAPADSPLTQQISIDMGRLAPFVSEASASRLNGSAHVTIRGLLVPSGITLIVGGGYHGKSTLLRTIAAGVHDKVPDDGREFCVTIQDAVTVRAEDGRYVNNCNISAFISNLPTPPGVETTVDTRHFSTCEASGSTSQATNVSEAIEMGAKALLVDEDVSAANFMARDGRMRSLVMDESITPLLYRVNGLHKTQGISTIVVVGGVGDWLDVPDQVILMDKYIAKDATKKAQSISYQFSYGHVQYAGRGVVHRLEWEKQGTPLPRRPANSSVTQLNKVSISLLEGGEAFSLYSDEIADATTKSNADLDDDIGCTDLSRSEQLFGKKPQLYGCGLCVAWILRESKLHPELTIPRLLERLDSVLDKEGMEKLSPYVPSSSVEGVNTALDSAMLVESLGFAIRPRKYEIGQALTRMRGIRMESLPEPEDEEEAAARREAERRQQQLADLWNARRKKGINNV